MTTRQKIVRRLILLAFLALLFAAGALGVVYFEVSRQANRDEARPADAIVVLGAAQYNGKPSPVLKARLDHALELYERKLANRIIATGGHGLGAKFSEGEVSRQYLSEHGVPAEFITVETTGQSTMQSVAAVGEIMDRMRLRSCIVVSDDYHMHRAKKMLEDAGLLVYGSPREAAPSDEWTRRKRFLRESLSYLMWRIGIRV
ncbi:MAG: YdcF family protein [Bryobacterales bacterium]